jgi:DNA-binding NtrC family response regulator
MELRPRPARSEPGTAQAKATILLVDDEPAVREGLALSLRPSGYHILEAGSGLEALAALQAGPVDVIVSDHLMPGMTGLELLAQVRDRFPDTARIMLTGHADMATAVRAINEGEIYRFLSKPCDRVELQVTVHLALERLELERENRRLLAVVRSRPELVAELESLHRLCRTLTLR